MLKLLRTSAPPDAEKRARQDDLARLATRARRGEADAVRTLVVVMGPALLRVVRRVLGADHPDVEDLTQEAAFNVVQALPRFREQCSVLHFACRVAVQTAMNSRRCEAVRARVVRLHGESDPGSDSATIPSPEEMLARQRAAALIRQLVASLPTPQGEALALHCMLGYTVAEIAASAGVSTETVRSRLRLARQALRRSMARLQVLRETMEGAS